MLPTIIHYCWYGANKKSRLIKKCIESWKKFFPDYEIIEWNETNTDLHENKYIEEAYREKKWAFVSDYVRMKVLFEYGGIYFDTDVQVIRKFPKEIMELSAFSGLESFSLKVSPGLVFACEPGNEIVKKLIDSYDADQFINESIDTIKTVNIRITDLLVENGLKEENVKQEIMGMTIFPSNVFCPYDGKRRKVKVEPESLTIHHYAASWLPWHRKLRLFIGTQIRHIIYLKK